MSEGKSSLISEETIERPKKRFKAFITQEEYERILTMFSKVKPKKSSYFYFDTSPSREEAELLKHNVRLRIRKRKGEYRLEIKKRRSPVKLEVIEFISKEEFEAFINNGAFPEGEVKLALAELGLRFPVQAIGSVKCIKHKLGRGDIDIIVEHSKYENGLIEQFEIELYSPIPLPKEYMRTILRELGVSTLDGRESKLRQFWSHKSNIQK